VLRTVIAPCARKLSLGPENPPAEPPPWVSRTGRAEDAHTWFDAEGVTNYSDPSASRAPGVQIVPLTPDRNLIQSVEVPPPDRPPGGSVQASDPNLAMADAERQVQCRPYEDSLRG